MKAFVRIIAVFFFCFGISATDFAQSSADPGLVAYFPFDGDVFDASTNANDGTAVGNVTFGIDRYGNVNRCLALPGGNQVMTGVDIPSLQNYPSLPASYAAWVLISNYPPYPAGLTCMTLLGRESCGVGDEGALAIYSDSSVPVSNSLAYFMGGSAAYTTFTPPTNQWCYIALTLSEDGVATFYVDGTNVTSYGSVSPSDNIDFRIGCSSGYGCDYQYDWSGLIDDLRIYNRVLSGDDVQSLYSVGAPVCDENAVARATVFDGFVIGAAIADGGCGFTTAPRVVFQGGGGTGASAFAIISNGVLSSIEITNAGHGYTTAPTIFVGVPPVIIRQPQSAVVTNGAPVVLSALGGGGSLNYQWRLNGSNIAGANLSVLDIPRFSVTNTGSYSVVVTNLLGSVTSAAAVVGIAPYFTQTPSNITTQWGYTNTLSVAASGSGPLAYQWYDNGFAITGATNSSLTFSGIQFSNSGAYSVVVTGLEGSITNAPVEISVGAAGTGFKISPVLNISGNVGEAVLIQRSSNLTAISGWVTLTNLVLTQPVQAWVDTTANAYLPGAPEYYYRILRH